MVVLTNAEQGRGLDRMLVDKILRSADITPDEAWITYLFHCRPTPGKQPTAAQRDACKLWLWRELEIVRPAFILAMGAPQTSLLLRKSTKLADVAGTVVPLPYLPGGVTSLIPSETTTRLMKGPVKNIVALCKTLKECRLAVKDRILSIG